MNKYTEALHLDIAQDIEKAARTYEEAIRMPDITLDAFINLACIYWESTDFGFNAAMSLEAEFVKIAGTRMWEVLDQAENKYIAYPEITFWRMYFKFTTLGEPPFVEKCLELVEQPNSTLVPYFHIYDQTKDKAYLPKARLLYQQVSDMKTTKNRYIIGILENDIEDSH
jgi:hypothetical protein